MPLTTGVALRTAMSFSSILGNLLHASLYQLLVSVGRFLGKSSGLFCVLWS
jgi:hypothetical protein